VQEQAIQRGPFEPEVSNADMDDKYNKL